MRIDGEEVLNELALFGPFVIVRGEKKHAIYAQPVWDYDDFNEAYPFPEPPVTGWSPNGKQKADVKSPKYKQALAEYYEAEWGYLMLKSLEPSKIDIPGVSLDDPETWGDVRLKITGKEAFSAHEFLRIHALVREANALSEEKLEANRESFLLEREATEKDSSSPTGEASNIKSGEPVSVSE